MQRTAGRRRRAVVNGVIALAMAATVFVTVHGTDATTPESQPLTGAAVGGTASEHTRHLLRLRDSRLLFLAAEVIGGTLQLGYRVSSDDGETWTSPVAIGAVVPDGTFGATVASNSRIYVVWEQLNGTTENLQFVELTPQSIGSFAIGPTRTVATGDLKPLPAPTVAEYNTLLGPGIAVGYGMKSAISDEYHVALSSDGGGTWLEPLTARCQTNRKWGMVTSVAGRLLCITNSSPNNLTWSEWNGVTWTPTQPTGVIQDTRDRSMPSTIATDDGTLHLVAESSGTVVYTSLPAGGVAWSLPKTLGPGTEPVISTTGTSLHVFASDPASVEESPIRVYVATDGKTWTAGRPIGGQRFSQVLDENLGWDFNKTSAGDDALFAFTDNSGSWGNKIGADSRSHRLDSSTKRLAFGFTPSVDLTATAVSIWATGQSAPQYRVGIQADDGTGRPSGHWIGEVTVGGVVVTGAFGSTPNGFSSGSNSQIDIDILDASLTGGHQYFVVTEFPPDQTGLQTPPGSANWIAPQTIGTYAGAETANPVLDRNALTWQPAPAEVPHFVVSTTTQPISQLITPTTTAPINQWQLPGETLTAARGGSPASLSLYVVRTNASLTAAPILRIFNGARTEIWTSAPLSSIAAGWFTIPTSGLSLTAGNRYTFVLDDEARQTTPAWSIQSSGSPSSSYDAGNSELVRAHDRLGFNDRTVEANSEYIAPNDLVLFNTNLNDALYLGADRPSDFVSLRRRYAGTATTVSLSYSTPSGWQSLPSTTNSVGNNTTGVAEFSPPSDWTQTTVDGRTAYWLRLTSNLTVVRQVAAERITGIRNLQFPTVADRATSVVPLAWSRYSEPAAVEVAQYDARPPDVANPTPQPFSNLLQIPTITAGLFDSGSGVDPSRVRVLLDGMAIASSATQTTVSATAGSSEPGLHLVTIEVPDIAGNVATTTFDFAVVTLSASAANASLEQQQVNIPAGASTVSLATRKGPPELSFARRMGPPVRQ